MNQPKEAGVVGRMKAAAKQGDRRERLLGSSGARILRNKILATFRNGRKIAKKIRWPGGG
jgi:hypothetical protein